MPVFDPTAAPRDPGAPALEPAAVADLLEASGRAFAAELAALGDEAARWRPAPGEWAATEVLGHVIEADRRGFGGRIRRILASDGEPEEAGWDQIAVAAERRDVERSVEAILAEFGPLRAEGIALVRSLDAEALDRAAVHDVVGRVTTRELLLEWAFHDRNHLRQLLANGQARLWPAMGNTRRFTVPDA